MLIALFSIYNRLLRRDLEQARCQWYFLGDFTAWSFGLGLALAGFLFQMGSEGLLLERRCLLVSTLALSTSYGAHSPRDFLPSLSSAITRIVMPSKFVSQPKIVS